MPRKNGLQTAPKSDYSQSSNACLSSVRGFHKAEAEGAATVVAEKARNPAQSRSGPEDPEG